MYLAVCSYLAHSTKQTLLGKLSSKSFDICLAPKLHCSIKHKVQRIMHIFISMRYHLFALSSPNRWSCLCRLPDSTHHQLYENSLLLIYQTWQHRSGDSIRTEWVTTQSSTTWQRKQTGFLHRLQLNMACLHRLNLVMSALPTVMHTQP